MPADSLVLPSACCIERICRLQQRNPAIMRMLIWHILRVQLRSKLQA